MTHVPAPAQSEADVVPLLFAHREYEWYSGPVAHQGRSVTLDMSTRTRKQFDNHDNT